MKKYLVIAAVAFAALVSCNKEISNEQMPQPSAVKEGYVEITLSAGMDASTKAVLDGNTVLWAVGDKVAVYPDAATTAEEFTVKTVEGKNVTITGSVPAGTTSLVAVYPYASALGRDGNTVTVDIPPTQDIPDGGTIDPAAMCSAAVYTDLSQTAQFQNLFSLLAFNVGDVTDANIVGLYATGLGAAIAGSFNASLTSDGPVLTPVTGSVDGSVKVFAEKGTFFAPETTFYAVVAPCVIEGFTAGVGNDSKLGTVTSAKSLTLERNKGVNLGDVSSKVTFKYRAIHNAEELQDFLATASVYTADDQVELANDIDMTGVALEPYKEGACSAAHSFAGVFDGKGYSIKNWTSEGVSLIDTVATTGIVKNLTIDPTCSITKAGTVYTAFIAQVLDGGMENCHNKAPITVSLTEAAITDKGIRLGGLAGLMDTVNSQMTDCSNSGDVTVTVALSGEMLGTIYMGGLVGAMPAPRTEESTRLLRCTNTGNISVATSSTNAEEQWLSTHYVGGIAGASGVNKDQGKASYYGNIDSCVNEGNVTATWTGGSGGYFKVGGILGYGECAIVGCTNKGNVSFASGDANGNAGPAVGGIAGVLAGAAPINAKDCVNEGKVSLSGLFVNAGSEYAGGMSGTKWASCGGCFGTVGDNTKLVDNCDNKGAVTVNARIKLDGGASATFGGIIGVNRAEVKNCDNTGDLTINASFLNAHIGGVVGYSYANISNCTFGAALKSVYDVTDFTGSAATSYYNNVGGIVGYAVKDVVTSVSNCSVTDSGSLDVKANGTTRIGGIVAMSYTPIDECTNSGSIKFVPLSVRPEALTSYIGGIAGFQGNATDATKLQTVSNCVNNGTLDVTMSSTFGTNHLAGIVGNCYGALLNDKNYGSISLEYLDGAATSSRVGGVAGTQAVDKSITKCNNEGKLTAKMSSAAAATLIGGILGYNKTTTISECDNKGDIEFDGGGMVKQAFIAGVNAVTQVKSTGYSDLSNSGNITATNWASTSNSYVGGITGAYSYSGTTVSSHTYTNCSNTGKLTVSSSSLMMIGGLAAQLNAASGKAKNCSNSGTVTVSGVAGNTRVAGITGYVGGGNMEGVYNYGAVSCTETKGACYVAGIAAAHNINATWDDIKSLGNITSDSNAKAGYLVGYFSSKGITLTVTSNHEFTATVNGAVPTENNAVGNLNSSTLVIQE